MNLENQLKALLPKELASSLLFVADPSGTEVDVRYARDRGLCELRFKSDSVLALSVVSFEFADESLAMLNKIGRRAIIEATEQIDTVIEKFRDLGFVWEDEYRSDEGMHLLECDLEATCTSIEEAAFLVRRIHELGRLHTVDLPESLFVTQVMKELKEDYTVECHHTLTDFTVYDSRGGEVAGYCDDEKSVALAWILAEWESDSNDEVAHIAEDMTAYVEDFFQTFKSAHTYRVDQVENVAEDANSVAIEVVCTTSCESIDDIRSIISDRQHIMRELSSPDWIP